MERQEHPEAATRLMADVAAGLGRIVKGELMLARADASEAISRAMSSLAMMVAAVVLGLVALNVFAGAAVAGLTEAGLAPGVAAVVVGGILLAIAIGLLVWARSALRSIGLLPRRAWRGVSQDARAVMAGLSGKGTPHV